MIRSILLMLVSGMLGAGLAFAGTAQEAADTPAGTASGYPPASGKGPGSGHSYRQGTSGPGQGSPNYRGDRGTEPAQAIDSAPGDGAEDAESGAVMPQSAIPGPYGYAPRSGYPYGRGRGVGYGRHQRGYGYGYPGYRGLGGGRYPHHRQYGNPPLYPAQPAASGPTADAE